MAGFEKTRAHLNGGICRQCWGTGMVPQRDRARGAEHARVLCRDCAGEGALP